MKTYNLMVMQDLLDPDTQKIFQCLVSKRRARLEDIASIFNLGAEDVASKLGRLKELKLIDEKQAVLPRWKTYYITADGLEAARKLKADTF